MIASKLEHLSIERAETPLNLICADRRDDEFGTKGVQGIGWIGVVSFILHPR